MRSESRRLARIFFEHEKQQFIADAGGGINEAPVASADSRSTMSSCDASAR
jgi:hypothetical protein